MVKKGSESSSKVDHSPQTMTYSQREVSSFFAARLKEALGTEPPAAAARRMGFNKQTFDAYLKGRIPRADDALVIADGLGLDFRWLMTGEGDREPADMVALPTFNDRPSAGGGAVAQTRYASGTVAFRADWLRALNINPRQAHVLFARGDSMEPTIRDGDMLIVDRSIDRVVDAGIYVVTVAGMLLVKRVQVRRDSTLVLKSDNGLYDDEIIPREDLPSIVVEGRVCWSGRPM